MTMSGQDQTGRSALVFLKFVGDLQLTEKPMHHRALVILTGTRCKNLLTWKEPE